MKRRTVLGFTSLLFLASTSTLAITAQADNSAEKTNNPTVGTTESPTKNLHPRATATPTDAQINSLSSEARSLESRVKALNADVANLKKVRTEEEQTHAKLQREIESNRKIAEADKEQAEVNHEQILQTEIQQAELHHLPLPGKTGGPVSLTKLQASTYTLGTTVTTSPYLGIRSAFDASDLLTNLPSMNEDLRLLQQRKELRQRLNKLNEVPIYDNRPLIELGGQLAAQGIYLRPYAGANSSDIDLTTAELDTLIVASTWAQAFMSLQYDNTQIPFSPQPGNRVANSRIYLTRGFLTIGDLTKFPVYLTAGQMYVPFGNYASYAVSDPLTKTIGRTNQRAALLGFSADGLYGQAYAFKGSSNVNAPGINQGGFNGGYQFTKGSFNGDVGAGYILNMADSAGMQDTGVPASYTNPPTFAVPQMGFQGFGVPPNVDPSVVPSNSNEHLYHRAPGVDLHGTLAYKAFTFISEYIGATKSFDARNLAYNDSGAQPKAMQLEGVYAFDVYQRPTNIALAYNRSWQALPLNVPEHSLFAVVNMSIWKDTVESLEFRHDINYSSSDTSSGNGAETPVNSAGSYQNMVTLQFAVYF